MTQPTTDQQIEIDEQGLDRYKANEVIVWLFSEKKIQFPEIVVMADNKGWSKEDVRQAAQLIGYSVSALDNLLSPENTKG